MILDRGGSVLVSQAGLGQQKCSLLCLNREDRMLEKGCYHSDATNRIRTTMPNDLF